MIRLETAVGLLSSAEAATRDMGLSMAFAVVDSAGHPVAMHRMDGAGFFTPRIAIAKAWTAVAFATETADLPERLAAAPYFVQAMTSMTDGLFVAGGGGAPIIVEGSMVGGIGASGGTAAQDAEVVASAMESLA